jgi:hypothetical protein
MNKFTRNTKSNFAAEFESLESRAGRKRTESRDAVEGQRNDLAQCGWKARTDWANGASNRKRGLERIDRKNRGRYFHICKRTDCSDIINALCPSDDLGENWHYRKNKKETRDAEGGVVLQVQILDAIQTARFGYF